MQVGVGANNRSAEHDQKIGKGQRSGPGEGSPRRVARDHRHEIDVEQRGDDHRGIAGVGEVVHCPRPQLTRANIGMQGRL